VPARFEIPPDSGRQLADSHNLQWRRLLTLRNRHETLLRLAERPEPKAGGQPDPAGEPVAGFEMEPIAGGFPGPWILLAASATSGTSPHATQLHFETEEGACEMPPVRLHVPRQGHVCEVIRLPSGTRRMVWKSIDIEFRPQWATVRPIGMLERMWRMLSRIIPAYYAYSSRKRSRSGLTLLRILTDLPGAYEAVGRLRSLPASRAYRRWLKRHDALRPGDLDLIARHVANMRSRPLISVLMPVFNTPERLLREAIESVLGQLYPHWELCIADDGSSRPHVRPLLEAYVRRDGRIKVTFRGFTGHISMASNAALSLATGDFIALLDHDDLLAPHALYWIAVEIERNPDAQIVYSDEDKIDEDGERFTPYCKPDWNPQLGLSQNFVSHLGVYRRETVQALGGFRTGYEGSQDYDLMLRVSESATPEQIRHVPAILYHWRAASGSTALSNAQKSYAWDAGRRAIQDHLQRRGVAAEVSRSRSASYYRVHYSLPDALLKVSIIIPTRDGFDLLSRCVESLLARTTYPNYEVLVVDNGSSEPRAVAFLDSLRGRQGFRVLSCPGAFNYSAMNNLAFENAEGEVLCLLNNDTEVITPDWIQEMAGCLLQPGVGIVGARLLFGDGTVQHAGVLAGVGGVANHVHAFIAQDHPGHFGRAWLAQDWSGVTGACMMIRRAVYDQLGGLDAEHLAVAFNDVDFCLRARAAGWRVVYTPYAELYHHESSTRGSDRGREKRQRAKRERDYMRKRWATELAEDPFYNPNLSHKPPFFTLSTKPRVKKPWLLADEVNEQFPQRRF
jgi:GT2 family glycosyltransferase